MIRPTILVVIASLIPLAAVTSLAAAPTAVASASEREARLEAKVEELERRIAALEAQLTCLSSAIPEAAETQVSGVQAANAQDAPLVLDDWDYSYKEGDFGQGYYSITLKLRNAGAKPIKLIDASVRFTDLLDQSLYGIKISPDITIAPGKNYTKKGHYRINQFINEQWRMKDMKKTDIKATLQVRRIVFADNSILEVER